MTAIHLHLACNHLPLWLQLSSTGLLARNYATDRGLIAALQVSTVLALWAAYWSGCEAAVAVGSLPIDCQSLAWHQEAALQVLVCSLAVLIFGLACRNRGLRLAVGLCFLIYLGYTSWLGGCIRHTELLMGTPP